MGLDTVIQKFRTSLGGFNREDVQLYIEHMTDVHRKEVSDLQKRLDQVEARNEELEKALSGVESEKSGAAEEEARVRASLETSTRSLSKLRGELSQTESKLAVARQELERLQAQVGTLEPMAESYAQLKDRVATVELDAHRKAQATVDEAKVEAGRIQAESKRWADSVLDQYWELRRGMDALLEQARLLCGISEQMEPLDISAQRLQKLVGLEPTDGQK